MAIREYRFNGTSKAGQPVQGTVFAPSAKKARIRVDVLAEQHAFSTRSIEKRETYSYKVRHINGNWMDGEQKAFSEAELRSALVKMGLDVINIRRRMLKM